MSTVAEAVSAIERGRTAVIPTDTVYGLVAGGYDEAPARAVYALKGRSDIQPTALVVASVDLLVECIPELKGRTAAVARALLPGPFTLVVPNPERRFRWLCGERPDVIGVRVPLLDGPGGAVLEAVGALIATSANLPGGPDPRSLDEVPDAILRGVDAIVDAGRLPGVPSTVLDLMGAAPVVLREGAVSGREAIARVLAALTAS